MNKGYIGLVVLTGAALACENVPQNQDLEASVLEQIEGVTFIQFNQGPVLTPEQMSYIVATRDYYRNTLGCREIISDQTIVIPYGKDTNPTNFIDSENRLNSFLYKVGGLSTYADEVNITTPQLIAKLKELNLIQSNLLTPIVFIDAENPIESANHELGHAVCQQATRVVFEQSLFESGDIVLGEKVTASLSKDPTIILHHEDGGMTYVVTLKEIHAMLLERTRDKQSRFGLDISVIPQLDKSDFAPEGTDPYTDIYNKVIQGMNDAGVIVDHTQLSDLIVRYVTQEGSESLATIAVELQRYNPNKSVTDILTSLLRLLYEGQEDLINSD
ncbi:MAG TPA: hypothetical protein PLV59_02875 [Candidatus Dojkabacteria bacterium]|nr:hypothetical protein [Candidatus Dojkabacteria bacterium]